MKSTELKEQIHRYLQENCLGRARPIRAIDLANRFNINIREVNDIIRALRLEGVLIGSSKEKPYGYYIPATEDEVRGYLNTYQSELFDMLSVYNRQKRAKRFYLENLKTRDLFSLEPCGQLAFT